MEEEAPQKSPKSILGNYDVCTYCMAVSSTVHIHHSDLANHNMALFATYFALHNLHQVEAKSHRDKVPMSGSLMPSNISLHL